MSEVEQNVLNLEETMNNFKIICAFLTSPQFIIDRVKELHFKNRASQNIHFLVTQRQIYFSLSSYISESEDIDYLKIKLDKMLKLYEELIKQEQKLDDLESLDKTKVNQVHSKINKMKEDYNKIKNYVNEIKTVIKTDDDLKQLQLEVKNYGNFLTSIGVDLPLLDENLAEPIHPSDFQFLTKLARSSYKENENDGFTKEEFDSSGIKSRISDLFISAPYYFNQSFGNCDLTTQAYLLDIIRSKGIDEQSKKRLETLENVYEISDINYSAVRSENAIDIAKAFAKFINLLSTNENTNLINKILSLNLIMEKFFKINTKEPMDGFVKMFMAAKYPITMALESRYKKLMMPIKETELNKEEKMNNIIKQLRTKDQKFDVAYQKNLIVIKTENALSKVNIKLLTIDNLNQEEVPKTVADVIDILLDENLDRDTLTLEKTIDLSKKVYEIIVKYKLFEDKNIENKINSYLSKKLYLAGEGVGDYKRNTSTSIYGLNPLDIWYDLNKILYINKNDNYDKMYLRYTEKITYEFKPFENLENSKRELTQLQIRSLPSNTDCVICGLDEQSLTTKFDDYIVRLYQRMFKVALKDKIIIDKPTVQKSGFKSQTVGFREGDEMKFRTAIYDYETLLYLTKKSPEVFKLTFFKEFGKLVSKIRELKYSKEELEKFVMLGTYKNYLNLIDRKDELEKLYTDYTKDNSDPTRYLEELEYLIFDKEKIR